MATLLRFLRGLFRRHRMQADAWRVAEQVMRRRRGLLARLAQGARR